jgi:iduronate 2-sulfatase
VLHELQALNLAQNTAVVLFSDNGFHLGESNIWQKMTNFELGVRIPLIFRVPWAQRAGTATPAIAEAVDIFPTLVEVAGLPPVPEGLQGTSLAATIANPPAVGTGAKRFAFSQHARCELWSPELNRKVLWDMCLGRKNWEIAAMGYSIRSDGWRFTQWVKWNGTAPIWAKSFGSELYDHRGDVGTDLDRSSPIQNLVDVPHNRFIVETLRNALQQQFNADRWPR